MELWNWNVQFPIFLQTRLLLFWLDWSHTKSETVPWSECARVHLLRLPTANVLSTYMFNTCVCTQPPSPPLFKNAEFLSWGIRMIYVVNQAKRCERHQQPHPYCCCSLLFPWGNLPADLWSIPSSHSVSLSRASRWAFNVKETQTVLYWPSVLPLLDPNNCMPFGLTLI